MPQQSHDRRSRVLVSWSCGKDSAWTLHTLRGDASVEVVGLLTTLDEQTDRVAMHGVRRSVVEVQARAAGLPLWDVPLPDPCPDAEYESRIGRVVGRAREAGVTAVAFGDLYLEDVRAYRERQMAGTGIAALFPLWGLATDALARTMLGSGLRAVVTCVDTQQIDRSFAGRWWDEAVLADLPPGADPCGEKGEMHTCAVAGPMFDTPLSVKVGEILDRGRFVFADVELEGPAAGPQAGLTETR